MVSVLVRDLTSYPSVVYVPTKLYTLKDALNSPNQLGFFFKQWKNIDALHENLCYSKISIKGRWENCLSFIYRVDQDD